MHQVISTRPAADNPSHRSLLHNAHLHGRSLVAALTILVVLRLFACGFYSVTSNSMAPVLLQGDWVLVNKLRYGPRIPFAQHHLPGYARVSLGDVALFVSPQIVGTGAYSTVLVKRVSGMEGDTILMRGGVLRRNEPPVHADSVQGQVMPLAYTERQLWWIRDRAIRGTRFGPPPVNPTITDWGPIVVPSDSLFLVGDNVYHSEDSRQFGFVGRDALIGKAAAVYFSLTRTTSGMRMQHGRFGHWIR